MDTKFREWSTPRHRRYGKTRRGRARRLRGQYRDDETGLHYNFFRFYDPASGRYTTPDPLGVGAAPNPVTYVSNPTGWTDPLGLMPDACRPDGDAPYSHDYDYLDRIRERALEDPRAHNFSYSFDDYIPELNPVVRPHDGALIYSVEGFMNENLGNFAIGVNPERVIIFHRSWTR